MYVWRQRRSPTLSYLFLTGFAQPARNINATLRLCCAAAVCWCWCHQMPVVSLAWVALETKSIKFPGNLDRMVKAGGGQVEGFSSGEGCALVWVGSFRSQHAVSCKSPHVARVLAPASLFCHAARHPQLNKGENALIRPRLAPSPLPPKQTPCPQPRSSTWPWARTSSSCLGVRRQLCLRAGRLRPALHTSAKCCLQQPPGPVPTGWRISRRLPACA